MPAPFLYEYLDFTAISSSSEVIIAFRSRNFENVAAIGQGINTGGSQAFIRGNKKARRLPGFFAESRAISITAFFWHPARIRGSYVAGTCPFHDTCCRTGCRIRSDPENNIASGVNCIRVMRRNV
ncbi:MAG TPA: hypothetical protein PKI87_00660, partial [Arenimonas sp.]|nr:hypothetical protein [Arenimonas sp.]